MATTTIALEVDADAARAFSAVSTEERRKLELLLSLRLQELTAQPVRPLKEIMDEIGQRAEARGLTLEILDSALREDKGGAVRVGNGRITLDLIVAQYENGMTPEE